MKLSNYFLQLMNNSSVQPKYFAYDWDDNLLYMDTKIHLLKNNENVSISTQEFAQVRNEIGQGVYTLLANNESFRDFLPSGNKQFILDAFTAQAGPSWNIFVNQTINKAKIFSIITARGHSIHTFKDVLKKMIKKNHMGIDKNEFSKNMLTFLHQEQNLFPDKNIKIQRNVDWLIEKYIKLCQFYPVANKNIQELLTIKGTTNSPEEAKHHALLHFSKHIKNQASNIYSHEVSITPRVGFSDDDKGNIQSMKVFMEKNGLGASIIPYLRDSSEGEVNAIPLKKLD